MRVDGSDAGGRIRQLPLESWAYTRQGMCYLEEGDVDRAIESLRRATFLDPNAALAHFGRGRACLRQGDRRGAGAALTQARRTLGAAPDGHELPGAEGVASQELRHTIKVQIVAL